jgi:hypothetical protein
MQVGSFDGEPVDRCGGGLAVNHLGVVVLTPRLARGHQDA